MSNNILKENGLIVQKNLEHFSIDKFNKLSTSKKAELFNINGKPFHFLFSQQFSKKFLTDFFRLTSRIKKISQTENGQMFLKEIGNDRYATLLFDQPSTRTMNSFVFALSRLGINYTINHDMNTSSEAKGETKEDTIKTMSTYDIDFLIMRSKNKNIAEQTAIKYNIPIINAGSGSDQHPTQALLDIFTMDEAFGEINNKKIAFTGDLYDGRTVRSLVYLLSLYKNVQLTFCAPKEYQIKEDILDFLRKKKTKFALTTNFKDVLKHSDAIYMTRIQEEYKEEKENLLSNLTTYLGNQIGLQYLSREPDAEKIIIQTHNLLNEITNKNPQINNKQIKQFCLTPDKFHFLGEKTKIFHPLPRVGEIDKSFDDDKRALYWTQSENGLWIRMAIFVFLLGKTEDVLNYY